MASVKKLPLFPLGLVLYPDELLPLHIFEPRYKEMTRLCKQTDSPFGVVFFDEGKMARIGCTARIKDIVKKFDDGRLDILVRGEQRFEVLKVFDIQSFLTADIDWLSEPPLSLRAEMQERVISQHMRLLELAGRTVRPSLYENQKALSFVIAPNAGLTLQQKQEVLEIVTEKERIDYLVDHLEKFIVRVKEMETLRHKIRSNGHFKDFPPEQ